MVLAEVRRRPCGPVAVRRVGVLVLALAACEAEDPNDYPINPGGGGGGGGGIGRDAGVDATGDGGTLLVGRVCLVSDLRALANCANVGAAGLLVTVGNRTAITSETGAFALVPPTGSGLYWRVTGAAIVPSVMELGATPVIPAIGSDAYLDLQTTNGVILSPGQGSVVLRVTRGGAPLAGAIVVASPVPQYPTFYDGANAMVWDEDATGGAGVAWLPGASTGTAAITITPPSGAAVADVLPVEDQAITYATVDVP
ncbi:MAG: hypothetical protein M3680_23520 [Myxococcota bacterium]|nr:hypothetical protein [Myxococcota bacterium]